MPIELDDLRTNLKNIRARIAQACDRAGRDPHTVELLPVTKGHGSDQIRHLYSLGFRRFGENYAQEMEQKADQLADLHDLHWVFLGHIQSNKIAKLVMVCNEMQALDTLSHAAHLARAAPQPFQVYVAVNAGEEDQKTGVPLSQVVQFTQDLQAYPQLEVQGLFAVPPQNLDLHAQNTLYAKIASLAHTIGKGHLSLGMSQDLEAAIEAGSTLVRIGTALLGPR